MEAGNSRDPLLGSNENIAIWRSGNKLSPSGHILLHYLWSRVQTKRMFVALKQVLTVKSVPPSSRTLNCRWSLLRTLFVFSHFLSYMKGFRTCFFNSVLIFSTSHVDLFSSVFEVEFISNDSFQIVNNELKLGCSFVSDLNPTNSESVSSRLKLTKFASAPPFSELERSSALSLQGTFTRLACISVRPPCLCSTCCRAPGSRAIGPGPAE